MIIHLATNYELEFYMTDTTNKTIPFQSEKGGSEATY